MTLPRRSTMMDELYGDAVAQAVYDRCQSLSPAFNQCVQEIVYDIFWRRPGITLQEKSFVTIVTLITLHKEEQLRIHLNGFFNLAGSLETIEKAIHFMFAEDYLSSELTALAILHDVIAEKQTVLNKKETLNVNAGFSLREKTLTELSVCIVRGEQSKTIAKLTEILQHKILTAAEIENVLLHQMLYCGFPCAMNGFAALKEIVDK